MSNVSDEARTFIMSQWDEASDAREDERFPQLKAAAGEFRVYEFEIEDLVMFKELRGYTAAAISSDGKIVHLTKIEAADDDAE